MAQTKCITIVGGGLAGLTLGIALLQRGISVTIREAGNYPRHRVCGEFISGRGQDSLNRLGLLEGLIERTGAVSARTIAFFSATKSTKPLPLPVPAICVSRFLLDSTLVKIFHELGGEVQNGDRFAEDFPEGFVRASGRRPQIKNEGPGWFGLKIHAQNVPLAADLELHVFSQGYVGLCRIDGGEVNVCGLFRKRAAENVEIKNRYELLLGQPGSPLRQRLAHAEFDPASFCAVAGLSLEPQSAATRAEICVGDALTMIPPITGNGMSMAFESAELAIQPLMAWSRSEATWQQTQKKIACDCDAAFNRRLAWAKYLQRIILTPALQNPLVALAAHTNCFWQLAFGRTR